MAVAVVVIVVVVVVVVVAIFKHVDLDGDGDLQSVKTEQKNLGLVCVVGLLLIVKWPRCFFFIAGEERLVLYNIAGQNDDKLFIRNKNKTKKKKKNTE